MCQLKKVEVNLVNPEPRRYLPRVTASLKMEAACALYNATDTHNTNKGRPLVPVVVHTMLAHGYKKKLSKH